MYLLVKWLVTRVEKLSDIEEHFFPFFWDVSMDYVSIYGYVLLPIVMLTSSERGSFRFFLQLNVPDITSPESKKAT